MHLQRAAPAAPQPDAAARNRALLAVGLLAVAVLSAFLWWLIRHEPEPAAPTGAPSAGAPSGQAPTTSTSPDGTTTAPGPTTVQAGPFRFESVAPNQVSDSCEDAAYGKVREWFADNPCRQVVRGLYRTESGDSRALVSIAVVTMPDEASAQTLKTMTDTSGTGNVSDMLRDGTVDLPGAPEVAGGTYASNTVGETVTIVESAFYGDTKNQALLEEITAQALKVGAEIR